MTELTEHAKTILRAIADGKQVERENITTKNWYVMSPHHALSYIGEGYAEELRIKPETRSINGVEFGAPGLGEHRLIIIAHCQDQESFYFEKS